MGSPPPALPGTDELDRTARQVRIDADRDDLPVHIVAADWSDAHLRGGRTRRALRACPTRRQPTSWTRRPRRAVDVVIEVTDEMIDAFYLAGQDGPDVRGGLAAVLAIVERDWNMQPRPPGSHLPAQANRCACPPLTCHGSSSRPPGVECGAVLDRDGAAP